MPRFITGDELGNLKAYTSTTESGSAGVQCSELLVENKKQKCGVQMLAIAKSKVGNVSRSMTGCAHTSEGKVASALADGTVSTYSLNAGDNTSLTEHNHWKENRLKHGQSFVGLAVSERYVQVM